MVQLLTFTSSIVRINLCQQLLNRTQLVCVIVVRLQASVAAASVAAAAATLAAHAAARAPPRVSAHALPDLPVLDALTALHGQLAVSAMPAMPTYESTCARN